MPEFHVSRFTEKLLAETKAARSPSPGRAPLYGTVSLSKPAPIPTGTSVEPRKLPVVPKRTLPTVVDDILPNPASVGALGRDTSASATVLHSVASPHSRGPAASPKLGQRGTQRTPTPRLGRGSSSPARKRHLSDSALRAPNPARGTPADDIATDVDFATELLTIGQRHAQEQEKSRGHNPIGGYLQPSGRGTTSLGDYEATVVPLSLPKGVDEDDGRGVTDASNLTATGQPLHVPYTPDIRAVGPAGDSAGGATGSRLHPKPMVLRDYQLLADACQRAGRARMEAHAYYKIGEIMASSGETLSAASVHFRRYLNLARRLNDLQGEGKALNALGIVSFELGVKTIKATASLDAAPKCESTTTVGVRLPAARQLFQQAVDFHRQHSEIADAAGVFIANINMGLSYSRMNDEAAAAACHKLALQHAVRAGDRAAESLALANLGEAGSNQGDFATAKVCVERHLELASTAADSTGTCEAHEQLGVLAMKRGDYSSASDEFVKALDVALRDDDSSKVRSLRCHIGVVQGLLHVGSAVEATATFMGAGGTSM